MTTIEQYIKRNSERFPDRIAVITSEEQISYRQFQQRIDACADKLRNVYSKGEIVALRTCQTIDFIVEYFALHVIGAVAMPLEHNMPDERFNAIASQYSHLSALNNTADVLYTTGTTGKAKGVMVSHDVILANSENLIDAMGFSGDLVFVVNGPLNHIGSLSKVFPVLIMGGTLYILEGMKNIEEFFEALHHPVASRCATFLVPTAIRMLLQFAEERLCELSERMDFIETGAAPMAQADMEHLCRILPNTRLYNTYASTETGIISTYNYNDGQCIAGCLGKPMKNSRYYITPEGTIACSGRTIMQGYAGDPELTATILRDGNLYTNDLGEIDEHGRLHLKGRNGDVINIGGFKIDPSEVEDVAKSHPLITDCICICDDSSSVSNRLKLLYVTMPGASVSNKELAMLLAEKLERYKVPQCFERVAAIERTFNGKLNRKFYRSQK